jgi:hypothetical protein
MPTAPKIDGDHPSIFWLAGRFAQGGARKRAGVALRAGSCGSATEERRGAAGFTACARSDEARRGALFLRCGRDLALRLYLRAREAAHGTRGMVPCAITRPNDRQAQGTPTPWLPRRLGRRREPGGW